MVNNILKNDGLNLHEVGLVRHQDKRAKKDVLRTENDVWAGNWFGWFLGHEGK
jgi:hypothetical protein